MTTTGAGLFVRFQPRAEPRLRLFCFPHAGGGTAVYRPWTAELPDWVELWAAAPPGREATFGTPPITSMRALVGALVESMRPHLDRPFALFGHSLGAIVAYETALVLESRGESPLQLTVSSHRGPHLPSPRPPIAHLPDAEFLEEVARLGGLPREVLESDELVALILPALRADFRLVESYHGSLESALRTPVSALGALDDYVSEDALAAWREVTSGGFGLRIFPGGHFYLNTERAALVAYLVGALEERLAACETGPSPARS